MRSNHAATLLGAALASFRTAAAVIGLVLAAFCGASVANVGAQSA
jgi:hypothetical protein